MSQFSLEYLQHLSQTQPSSQVLNRKKLVCPKCKTTKFRKNVQGHLVCIHGHELPHYRTEVSEEFDPTFSHVTLKKKSNKKKKNNRSLISEFGQHRQVLIFEAFQFILKKQIEILQIEMNFPAELSDIVRDLWIMYVTSTKTYYSRGEIKSKQEHHEEDEEINRILREAGVSDSDSDSGSGSNSGSNSDTDSDNYSDVDTDMDSDMNTDIDSDSNTDLESNYSSDETIVKGEKEEEENDDDDNHSKRLKLSSENHKSRKKNEKLKEKKSKKKRKFKKNKIKNKNKSNKEKTPEEMIEEIHKYIRPTKDRYSLTRLSVIFLYMGCLWLRLPVMISDFHTWISNEDIPYFSAIYCVPYKIKRLLNKKEVNVLIPKYIPDCEWMYKYTNRMIMYYKKFFKISFPPINYPLIGCRMLSLLALPAEAYICVSRLIQLLKLDFSYKTKFSNPTIELLALIIIVVKIIYGLDNEHRFSDEFCENFYSLEEWLDCLLQRRKEYDTHGLPIHETDYITYINNNLEKYIDYCQKTFIDRHSKDDKEINNYKIFKNIIKFIRKEKRIDQRNNDEEENDDIKIKDSLSINAPSFHFSQSYSNSNSTLQNESEIVDNNIDDTISGFQTIPLNNNDKMKDKQKKRKYTKNDESENDDIQKTTTKLKNIYNKKYPGEHYISYHKMDQGGDYHTSYTVVLQYCQDVILRFNNDWLQIIIKSLEKKLLRNEVWLKEYFNQKKFISDTTLISSSSSMNSNNNKGKNIWKKEKSFNNQNNVDNDENNDYEEQEIFSLLLEDETGNKGNDNDNDNDDSDSEEEEEEEEYIDFSDENEYQKDLIEALMKYAEKDEIEYPFY